MTKRVQVHKAQVCGGREVDDLVLYVGPETVEAQAEDLPFDDVMKRSRAVAQGEAKKIVDALQGSLPGGVLDMVLVELLARKASVLLAPFYPSTVYPSESP